jgi:phosphate transport system substrate-binding protein
MDIWPGSCRPAAKGDPSKMHLKRIGLSAALALALALPASASATTLIGSGSSVAQPYLQALFAGYHRVAPGVSFLYTADGGNAGVKDVQAGRSQFAAQSRPPLPSDAGTTYVKLFLDGLCIYVNPQNKLTNISIPELSDVFTGVRTSWSQIPGSGLSTTIDPVGRDSTAGSFTFFTASVLNGATQGSNVTTQASDGLVANAIKQDPNSIGYAGLARAKDSGLKRISLNGVACSAPFVKTMKYPLSRFLWLVIPTASPNLEVEKFADWVRTSVAAGEIISKAGGVPAFNKTKKKHKKH